MTPTSCLQGAQQQQERQQPCIVRLSCRKSLLSWRGLLEAGRAQERVRLQTGLTSNHPNVLSLSSFAHSARASH